MELSARYPSYEEFKKERHTRIDEEESDARRRRNEISVAGGELNSLIGPRSR
jgi:hypothetical protein